MSSMKIELTKEQKARLEKVVKEKKEIYAWRRAKAIILLEAGEKINNLSKIFGVHRNSIGRWLKEWRKDEKLFAKVGRGAKPKLTKEMQTDLEIYIKENPLSITKAYQMIKEKYSISIHRTTIVRYIKKIQIQKNKTDIGKKT